MTLEDDIAHLRKLDFFAGFNEEQLRMLAFGSRKMRFSDGAELFHPGQSTDGAYLLQTGKIGIRQPMHNGEDRFDELGPGSLIGELALISRNKRIGTAIVLEACEVLKIQRDAMHRILEEYPELAVDLHQRISSSIINIGKELEKVQSRLPVDDISDSG